MPVGSMMSRYHCSASDYVAAQQKQRDDALASYRRGHEIMQRLTRVAPDDVAYKLELDWFEARLSELK